MSKKIALVSGANGFIGRHLVNELLSEGWLINALTSPKNVSIASTVLPRVQWFPACPTGTKRACEGIDAYFNFAACYDSIEPDPDTILYVNYSYPISVIFEIIQSSRKCVTLVLGDTFYRKFSISDTQQKFYVAAKKMFCEEVRRLSSVHSNQFRAALLVIEQVYGAGERLEKAYPSVVRQLLDEELRRLPLTAGTQRRDFIYVSDVARAAKMVFAAEWTKCIDIGCGTGESIEVGNVFRILKQITCSKVELGFGDIEYHQTISESVASCRFLNSIGWTPSVSLESGLRLLVNDVVSRSRPGLNSS